MTSLLAAFIIQFFFSQDDFLTRKGGDFQILLIKFLSF